MRQIGAYDQLQYRHSLQTHLIIFHFARRAHRAEIPLLADDFLGLAAVGGRPANRELLCALVVRLDEPKLDAVQGSRFIEDEADLLFAIFGSTPSGAGRGIKDGFNGEPRILRSYLHGGDLAQIDPGLA